MVNALKSSKEWIETFQSGKRKASISQLWRSKSHRWVMSSVQTSIWFKLTSFRVRATCLILKRILRHQKVEVSGGTPTSMLRASNRSTTASSQQLWQRQRLALTINSMTRCIKIRTRRRFGLTLGKSPQMWFTIIHLSAPTSCSTAIKCTLCSRQSPDCSPVTSSCLNLCIYQGKIQAKTKWSAGVLYQS